MFSRPYSFAWLAADDVRPVISSISIQISLECMPPLYQEFLDVVVSAGLAHGSNFIFITCCGTTTVIDGNRLVTELQPPSFDATKSSTAPSAAALQVKLPVTSTRDSRLMTRIRVSGPAARPARESQCPNRPASRGKPLRSRSYRKWLQNSLGPGAGESVETGAWSFWRTEERPRAAGSSRMASKKTQAGHFKLEGRRVYYVRAGQEYSRAGWEPDAATTRMPAG